MDHDSEIDSLKRTRRRICGRISRRRNAGGGAWNRLHGQVRGRGDWKAGAGRSAHRWLPYIGTHRRAGPHFGIPLGTLAENTRLDLTIDGADEVETGSLGMIKGRGGALLREKIVASVSNRFAIVVDETKIVERLGRGPLPVEVVPFGWECTVPRLRDAGATPVLRLGTDGKPYLTDGGHYILDCMINGALSPDSLAKDTRQHRRAFVEHGFVPRNGHPGLCGKPARRQSVIPLRGRSQKAFAAIYRRKFLEIDNN